jgi:NAD(P)-dependent dehydrogenase (short-subunit alcohol dehydrogenase family)
MDLDGKTALVTGGSGDIGRAIAGALAAAGVDVAISYVGHLNGATAVADAVRAAGRRSLAVQLDQRDPAAIDAAVDTVVRALGRLESEGNMNGPPAAVGPPLVAVTAT